MHEMQRKQGCVANASNGDMGDIIHGPTPGELTCLHPIGGLSWVSAEL